MTLLTDPDSFVAARDVNTQVRGMVHTVTHLVTVEEVD